MTTQVMTQARPKTAHALPELAVRLVSALLALAVAGVHVADQGGVTRFTSPDWLGWGYRLIEVGGVLTAIALLLPWLSRLGWAAAVMLGTGPFLGYLASRSIGLPGDHMDIGNWGYWVGTVSLIVEAALIILSLGMLWSARRLARERISRLRGRNHRTFCQNASMLTGFGAPVAGAWATAGHLGSFAEQAEQAGYASLWTFQRLLVPEGSGMEPVYRSVLDPMVALGYAAARTSRIRLGVAVINLPFVSPGYLAKQASTVDVLSGGRLDLGLGIGWMPEEFALTGASTARRGARTEEYLAVLRTLWADEVSSLRGEFYTVPAGRQDPRPAQRPGPPVLLGGMSRPAMERAGRIADGWITSSRADLSKISEAVAVIQDAAAAAGRDPGQLRIICRGVVRVDGDGKQVLCGDYDKIRGDAEWLATQGVTELFYDLNWDPQVGNPSVSPDSAAARARDILIALAP